VAGTGDDILRNQIPGVSAGGLSGQFDSGPLRATVEDEQRCK
jgi:hypothetical protein